MEDQVRPLLLAALLAIAPILPIARGQSSAAPKAEAAEQQTSGQELSSRVPPAKAGDVKSIDSILAAVYDVISGPAGDRDWNRFRSLFVPEGRLPSAQK